MPCYYFNVYDDLVTVDDEGIVLANVGAAREVALRSARSLIAEQALKGSIKLHHWIEVEDEDRRPVLTLPFGAAVEVVKDPD